MDNLKEKILQAKEHRYRTQEQLIEKYQLPIISFTLVLPGGFMNYPEYKQVFDQGVSCVRSELTTIIHEYLTDGGWGPEGFWVANEDPQVVKKRAVLLEEENPLGRLWDLDVFDNEMRPLSRIEIGYPARKCLICNDDASTCYRTKRHTLEEIQKQVQGIIDKGLLYSF